MFDAIRRRFRREPEPRFNLYDYGYPNENPVHRMMWPECRLPLPHGHDLGILVDPDRADQAETPR